MANDTEVRNDTYVFYEMRFDLQTGDYERTGRSGTREAIHRAGHRIDAGSLGSCPHQWIDARGYVDLELANKHPYPHRRQLALA
jgi:hypothetical protein